MSFGRPKEHIHPDAKKAWRIKGGIALFIELLFVVGYFILARFVDVFPMFVLFILLGLTALAGVVQIVIIPAVRMIYWGYDIREDEIDIQYGLIVFKRSLIPMTKVQHVDTEHGPILRLFSLATLSISTAGTTHKIPALRQETAQALRAKISNLALVSDEDV